MAEQESPRRWGRGWLLWLAAFAGAVAIGLAGSLASSVRAFAIPTNSMSPTLRSGDRVGVDTRPRSRPKRGEVWVFHMPGWASAGAGMVVKRVVALPGETVEVASGRVLINGVPLAEPYLAKPMTYTLPPRALGPDQYFVLGDSRDASHDSHVWGPLPGDHLIGPVKLRYWPPKRIGRL
jgi:signal peptidase I